MIFDFQETHMVGGIIQFPDYPFAALEKQPSDVMETVVLRGTTAGVSFGLTGTADQPE